MARVLEDFPSINEIENVPFFQNILKFCIFLPKPAFPFLPIFNVFLPFLQKIVHMPLLSRICPDRHGDLGKNVIPILF